MMTNENMSRSFESHICISLGPIAAISLFFRKLEVPTRRAAFLMRWKMETHTSEKNHCPLVRGCKFQFSRNWNSFRLQMLLAHVRGTYVDLASRSIGVRLFVIC